MKILLRLISFWIFIPAVKTLNVCLIFNHLSRHGVLLAVSYIFQIRFLIIADHRRLRGLRIVDKRREIVFISPGSETQK